METLPTAQETPEERAARIKAEFLAFKRPQTEAEHRAMQAKEVAAQQAVSQAVEVQKL